MRQSLSVTCASLWFSFEAPIPSINRTDHHDMNDILLKVTLKIKNHNTRSQKTLQVKLIFLWIFSSSLLPLLRKNNLIILGRNKMRGGEGITMSEQFHNSIGESYQEAKSLPQHTNT